MVKLATVVFLGGMVATLVWATDEGPTHPAGPKDLTGPSALKSTRVTADELAGVYRENAVAAERWVGQVVEVTGTARKIGRSGENYFVQFSEDVVAWFPFRGRLAQIERGDRVRASCTVTSAQGRIELACNNGRR